LGSYFFVFDKYYNLKNMDCQGISPKYQAVNIVAGKNNKLLLVNILIKV